MLHIRRSHRTEALVEDLAALLAQPLDDPMQAERLLVGSRGMERWLAAELATRSQAGVFANVEVDFPARFVARLVDDVLGPRELLGVDPWDPDALVWTIAGRLPDAIADDPSAFPAVARYLRVEARDSDEGVDDGTGQLAFPVDEEAVARGFVVDRKLLGFAGQTAELFDRYALHRPEMVRQWAQGRDVDPQGRALGDQRWQAELWRAIAREQRSVQAPPERIAAAVEQLAAGGRLSQDVPPRLVAFGVSTLPPLHLDLLAAVANQREVHVYVPSPSPTLWQLGWEGTSDDVQPDNALLRAAGPVGRHAATLVRTAGRRRGVTVADGAPGEELPSGDRGRSPSLLARLQDDLVTDTPLPLEPDPRLRADKDDRSIVFHDGHGAVRQVEALHDELRRRFTEDPTLQPRDVVVLTPDLATYAPLVAAVFADPGGRWPDGVAHDGEPPTIPVAVGDRSAGRGNPVASVLTQLLALVHARTSGAEVLDLLSTEPVRVRFRISPRELETIQRWVEDTGVAWARDEADRARQGQPARREHTWAAAVDRLLLGVAMADDDERMLDGVVPYDAIEDASDLDLLDRLTRFLDVVDELVELERSRSLSEWSRTLAELLDDVVGPATGLPWQDDGARNEHRRHRERVDRVLATLDRANDTLGRDVEVRALARWVGAALERAGSSPAGHGTGAVTVAELVPLRAIPFRVVCLLGMDTGSFPRGDTPPGHDLAARDPRPGDRDRRAEDRALFLDAIHAARDALVVCYAGRDPVSGREQPPAIPVAELLDAVEAYIGEEGRAARTIVHPVLPTGPASFDVTLPHGPYSFDRVRLEAARVAQRDQRTPPLFVRDALPPPDGDADERLHLDQLTRVVAKPAQALLDRLRIARPEDLRTFPETEPLQLDALERWKLGTDLLDAADEVATTERTYDDVLAATLARGRLPAGAVGRHAVRDVVDIARQMTTCLDQLGPRVHWPVEVAVDGRLLEGSVRVAGHEGEGFQLVETWYGKADGRRHLRAWLRHLAAAVDRPDERLRTFIQARADNSGGVRRFVYPAMTADTAHAELRRWLDLHDRARCERVPFVAKVSWTYVQQRREAERIAHEHGGVPLEEVEGLSDDELVEAHGDVARTKKTTVASCVAKAHEDAEKLWGRDDLDRGFPEREQPHVRLVFRDVQQWGDLVRRTPLLEESLRLLRPLADAVTNGKAAAHEVCS